MKLTLPYSLIILIIGFLSAHGQDMVNKRPAFKIVQRDFVLSNPPFKSCHASTLAELNDGSVMVAFFAGSYEGARDVKIWSAVSINGDWANPRIIADGKVSDSLSYPCWNPVLFKSANGKLYLFYKIGKNPREWFGMMKSSVTDGRTWSEPLKLPAGCMGPVKNKPVELANGLLLCPSSTETETAWKVQMELFDPAKNDWKIIKVDQENPFQVIQPSILTYPDSTCRILCRSKSNAVITSLSKDSGKSWSNLTAIGLPNPNSGIDGVTLKDGSHLLVYNPLLSGKEWVNGRNQLNLAWSADGITWKDILVLEKEPTGEFSYPAIIQSSDSKVHIAYTYKRIQIKHWILQTVPGE
ncbi:MAG: sialidase family protein [Bacteroidales bacterium]|jgi:alpha-L-fucosidase